MNIFYILLMIFLLFRQSIIHRDQIKWSANNGSCQFSTLIKEKLVCTEQMTSYDIEHVNKYEFNGVLITQIQL